MTDFLVKGLNLTEHRITELHVSVRFRSFLIKSSLENEISIKIMDSKLYKFCKGIF